jgi:urea transporter
MHTTTQFTITRTDLEKIITRICCGYAFILFTESPRVGWLFLLVTFWFPNIGACGLIAVLIATALAEGLKLRNLTSGLHLYNSLLVGLSLGAHYQLDANLLLLLLLSSVLTVFLSVLFCEWLWRTERLPALSIPFVLVALIAAFASQSYGELDYFLPPPSDYELFLSVPADYFLTALGATFFTPQPLAGLLLLCGIIYTSRYLALLSICGFVVGNSVYGLLAGGWYSALSVNSGFNFILTALALGGIFTVPSWQSFVLAMFGSAIAALLTAAMQSVLLPYGVSIMAVPFLVTTLTLLAGFNKRYVTGSPTLLLENPALPEVSMERVRLAKVRGFGNSALTLAAPFMGEWRVYQGMNGEHTHQAPWQHALDFIMTDEQGKSYQTSGEFLEDYYSFGLPVLSPVYGQVSSCVNYLPDHAIGEVDMQNNWGNYVLICVDYQHYVLVAHLQQHSVQVAMGDWVYPGQKIAQCGNTGRSPQPHIHLHVQQTPYLGSATMDFVLGNVVIQREQQRQFYLNVLPRKNDVVSAQLADSKLAPTLHLPVGKQFCYRFRKNDRAWQSHCFTVILTLTGEFRLQSDSGASVAFVETDKVLAFYDRNAIADACLDLWLLNLGLTPLVNGHLHWQDQPAVRLLPLPPLQKGLYQLLPFGHRLHCDYQRQWQVESEGWLQKTLLHYRCYWHKKQTFQAQAVILPNLGCVNMQLQLHDDVFEAHLQGYGRADDIGVPGIKNSNDLGSD